MSTEYNWIETDSINGAGMSCIKYGHTVLPTGQLIFKKVKYPSLFASLIDNAKEKGFETEIIETFEVYADLISNDQPTSIEGATDIRGNWNEDGDGNDNDYIWFHVFSDEQKAIEYAMTLPPAIFNEFAEVHSN